MKTKAINRKDYSERYTPSIVRSWLTVKSKGLVQDAMTEMNNVLNAKHRLARVYEWARGNRNLPPEVYDYMLYDLLVVEGFAFTGKNGFEDLRHPPGV